MNIKALLATLVALYKHAKAEHAERKWLKLVQKKDKLREEIIRAKAAYVAARAALTAPQSGQVVAPPSVEVTTQ